MSRLILGLVLASLVTLSAPPRGHGAELDDAGWDHESLRLLMERVAPAVEHLG
jgi:hypothetical protein